MDIEAWLHAGYEERIGTRNTNVKEREETWNLHIAIAGPRPRREISYGVHVPMYLRRRMKFCKIYARTPSSSGRGRRILWNGSEFRAGSCQFYFRVNSSAVQVFGTFSEV